jgi:hypothetical protein
MKTVETITRSGDIADYKKATTYYEHGEKFYEIDGEKYMCVEERHDTADGVNMGKTITLRMCIGFPAAAKEPIIAHDVGYKSSLLAGLSAGIYARQPVDISHVELEATICSMNHFAGGLTSTVKGDLEYACKKAVGYIEILRHIITAPEQKAQKPSDFRKAFEAWGLKNGSRCWSPTEEYTAWAAWQAAWNRRAE